MGGEVRDVRGFRIKGRVQGVFFRAWTQDMAKGLELRGVVRNLSDGSVEAWAEGPVGQLEVFEKQLWIGPPASLVEAVERTSPGGPLPDKGFIILR